MQAVSKDRDLGIKTRTEAQISKLKTSDPRRWGLEHKSLSSIDLIQSKATVGPEQLKQWGWRDPGRKSLESLS